MKIEIFLVPLCKCILILCKFSIVKVDKGLQSDPTRSFKLPISGCAYLVLTGLHFRKQISTDSFLDIYAIPSK